MVSSDIVFVQKRIMPKWFFCLVGLARKKLIFDIDDAVYTTPLGMHESEEQLEKRRKMLGK